MEVRVLYTNWRQVGSISDGDGCGEDYDKDEVGKNGVVSIQENQPMNGNELWNFVVKYDDGSVKRVFNPNRIEYLTAQ
jgi:hypothetical protein